MLSSMSKCADILSFWSPLILNYHHSATRSNLVRNFRAISNNFSVIVGLSRDATTETRLTLLALTASWKGTPLQVPVERLKRRCKPGIRPQGFWRVAVRSSVERWRELSIWSGLVWRLKVRKLKPTTQSPFHSYSRTVLASRIHPQGFRASCTYLHDGSQQ